MRVGISEERFLHDVFGVLFAILCVMFHNPERKIFVRSVHQLFKTRKYHHDLAADTPVCASSSADGLGRSSASFLGSVALNNPWCSKWAGQIDQCRAVAAILAGVPLSLHCLLLALHMLVAPLHFAISRSGATPRFQNFSDISC